MKKKLEKTIENALRDNLLWTEKIKKDFEDHKVFFAIRNNLIDFYHKGGRLFCFDSKGFKTHFKYASVISANGNDYLTESELANYKLASDFKTNYTRIKENCSKYSGIEASGVSALYHKHSYLSKSNVVVLDIEVSFKALNGKKTQDRIDLLLFKKDSRILQFVEAKHYSNKEIWSNKKPKIIEQIEGYEKQVAQRKKQILSEYSEYVKILNGLFNISLPMPINIEKKVALLIFGFDRDQQNGRLKKLITENCEYKGIKNYSIGNIKQVVPENLWKEAKVL